jgi:hypothetical protein
MRAYDMLISAPIRATVVKRAYESDPVTMRAAGLGLTVLLDPSSQLPVLRAARPGVKLERPQPRSKAAKLNDL